MLDIARLIRDGLPVDVIDTLIGGKTVTPDEVSRIIMPPKAVVRAPPQGRPDAGAVWTGSSVSPASSPRRWKPSAPARRR